MLRQIIIVILMSPYCFFSQKVSKQKISRQPYFKYTIPTAEKNDSITFYLSEFLEKTVQPLIIYVQGSGNSSLFKKDSTGKISPNLGHINWAYNTKEKARLLIIEKPGVSFLDNRFENALFDQKFSLDSWSARIIQVIKYVVKNEKIDSKKIMIVGHSEGGLVAAKVANDSKGLISNVAILAGEGPSQLYSLNKLAEAGELFYTENPDKEKRLDSLNRAWQQIQSNPNATNKKFWGLTFLRWSTFLKTSVIDQLASYDGKIMIVQGKNDKNVFPESANILYTSLLSKGKQPQLEMISGADHSFNFDDNKNRNGWDEVSKKCIAWFLP